MNTLASIQNLISFSILMMFHFILPVQSQFVREHKQLQSTHNISYLSTLHISSQREAYVTLLYDDFYTLPVVVSMHSLLLNSPDISQNIRDRIVLVTSNVGAHSRQLLTQEGILVREMPQVHNPFMDNHLFQKRFASIFTKLLIFNMTQYHRVLYFDGDTLITGDLSNIFKCGKLCIRYLDPCYFNAGIIMTEPSQIMFSRLIEALNYLSSYDGGDQGFLNDFFAEAYYSPMCEFNQEYSDVKVCRLPNEYHTDHGVYYKSMKWEDQSGNQCGKRRIMHYVGMPMVKPWLFVPSALLDLSMEWENYRSLIENRSILYTLWKHRWFCMNCVLFSGFVWICVEFLVQHFGLKLARMNHLKVDSVMVLPLVILMGIFLLLMCTGIAAFLWMPTGAGIIEGSLYYIGYKCVLNSLVIAFLVLFSASQSRISDQIRTYKVSEISLRHLIILSFSIAICESILPILYVVLVNQFHYSSLFTKALILCGFGGFFYLIITSFLLGFLSILWISWNAARSLTSH